MLKGLKIREISFHESLTNKDKRLDTDFWTEVPAYNKSLTYTTVGAILTDSQYGISIAMNENGTGIPIYRMNKIHNMLCDFSVSKCAPLTQEEEKLFLLNDRDVLFNRTNSYELVGRTGLYRKQIDKNFVFASYLVRFVPDETKVLPEYLTSFLNTRYGVAEIRRRARQSVNQTNVNPEEVKAIALPILSKEFQERIKSNFDQAASNLILSEKKYNAAENLLLGTLELIQFKPTTKTINIKSFKDSFNVSGRLDAEYYQPRYEDWTQAISTYKHGVSTIANACKVKDKSFIPKDEEIYSYIELSDIDKTGGITGTTVAIGAVLPMRARRMVKQGDVLVSSIEGSLSSCALVTKEHDGALCSTGFYVLHSDKINSETLLVLMKSAPIQALLKQGCSGTILTAINSDSFLNIPVPLIDSHIQQEIAGYIQESFTLKIESEELLEVAKRSVEIAIEQDEQAGLEYMTQKTKHVDGVTNS